MLHAKLPGSGLSIIRNSTRAPSVERWSCSFVPMTQLQLSTSARSCFERANARMLSSRNYIVAADSSTNYHPLAVIRAKPFAAGATSLAQIKSLRACSFNPAVHRTPGDDLHACHRSQTVQVLEADIDCAYFATPLRTRNPQWYTRPSSCSLEWR
jgi:hypothetical protein